MSRIRVLIADPSDIFQEGIRSILVTSDLFEMAGRVDAVDEVYPRIVGLRPDICLLSLSLKGLNPAVLLKQIRESSTTTRVLLVSEPSEFPVVGRLIQVGAAGCITRNVEKKSLLRLLQRTAKGERVFSNEISRFINKHYSADIDTSGKPRRKSTAKTITRREREILQLIVEGYTSQEIASTLFISPRTVETHRSNLLHKLELKNTAGLVRYAMQEELNPNS